MISISLVFLSFGIINICAQECKDVRMKMSSTKPGRVELDVDQFCRCAGYSKTPSKVATEFTKWKKPTTEVVKNTEKPFKDKSTNSTAFDYPTERTTDKSLFVTTTKKVETERTDKSETLVRADEATEKRTVDEDKRFTSEKSETTSAYLTTKEIIDEKAVKNSTGKDMPTIYKTPSTEKMTTKMSGKADEFHDESVIEVTTESSDGVTEKRVIDEDKSIADHTSETSSTYLTTKKNTVTEKSAGIKDSDKKSTEKADLDDTDEKSSLTTDMIPEKGVVLTEDKNSTHYIDDKRSIYNTTEKVTDVEEVVYKKSTEKDIDVIYETLITEKIKTTTEKIVVSSFDESVIDLYNITEKPSKSIATEKVTDMEASVHTRKNNTEKEAMIYKNLTTEKLIPTTEKEDELMKESAKDMSTRKGVDDKSSIYNVTEKITTRKDKDTVTKFNGTEKVIDEIYSDKKAYSDSTTMMTEKVGNITTERSVKNATDRNSTHDVIDESIVSSTTEIVFDIPVEKDIFKSATDKNSTDEIIFKNTTTTEKVTEKITVKATNKTPTDTVKSSIDLTTVAVDKAGTHITDKFADSGTKAIEKVVVKFEPDRRPDATHTTTKVYKNEKKIENSSDAALGASRTNGSDYGLQIFLILLAIIVITGFIFAAFYIVYMSFRSNSYVLPPSGEATPLNNI